MDNKWILTYYQAPSPERFVEEVRSMIADDVLKNAGSFEGRYVGFFTKIFLDNESSVEGWFKELEIFKNEQWLLVMAAARTRSDNLLNFLEQNGLPREASKECKPILLEEWDHGYTLDMLWGCFLASGEEAPVRKIMAALNFADYQGNAERLAARDADAEVTDEDHEAIHYEGLFEASFNSLHDMADDHPLLIQYYDKIISEGSDKMSVDEYMYLGILLSDLRPENYRVEIEEEKFTLHFL